MARWLYDFERVYSFPDFDYRGPSFGFASMPDQFVVDLIHRREVARAPSGLFVQYALISSHAPWNEQPTFVDDWSQLGDGRLYATRSPTRFPVGWTNLGDGGPGYIHAIIYDLQMLASYLTRFVPGDALVIVLGDHQPVAEVTGGSRSAAVPVHVISRRRDHLEAFFRRGYTAGMLPRANATPPGLETFLPGLTADFSNSR
jgi:hypothetical protein